jgi:hypothetical protein
MGLCFAVSAILMIFVNHITQFGHKLDLMIILSVTDKRVTKKSVVRSNRFN